MAGLSMAGRDSKEVRDGNRVAAKKRLDSIKGANLQSGGGFTPQPSALASLGRTFFLFYGLREGRFLYGIRRWQVERVERQRTFEDTQATEVRLLNLQFAHSLFRLLGPLF